MTRNRNAPRRPPPTPLKFRKPTDKEIEEWAQRDKHKERVVAEFMPHIDAVYIRQKEELVHNVMSTFHNIIINAKSVNYSNRTCGICSNKMVGMIYTMPCCKKQLRLECLFKADLKCPFCREEIQLEVEEDPPQVIFQNIMNSYCMSNVMDFMRKQNTQA